MQLNIILAPTAGIVILSTSTVVLPGKERKCRRDITAGAYSSCPHRILLCVFLFSGLGQDHHWGKKLHFLNIGVIAQHTTSVQLHSHLLTFQRSDEHLAMPTSSGRRSGVSSSPNAHRTSVPAALSLAKILVLGVTRLPLLRAAPASLREVVTVDGGEEPKSASDPGLWLYLTFAVILVLLGGIFAGLTIA